MAYLSREEIDSMGFKRVGKGVLISDTALFYGREKIEIGDFSRFDDFTVVSGCVRFGNYVHIALRCSILASDKTIAFGDFSGLSPGCQMLASFDDYSGESLTNPTVPSSYRNYTSADIALGRHVIVGANSIIGPGVQVGEGAAIGALSLVVSKVNDWTIVGGVPAKEIKKRSKNLLLLEQEFLNSTKA